MRKRIRKTLMVLLCATTLFSLTACGSKEPAPEAINDSEKTTETVETVSENTVNTENVSMIQESCGVKEDLAVEMSKALEELGFGTIKEWSLIEGDASNKVKIKNVDKTIYYIVIVDGNVTEIIDENENQVWLNANIAQVTIKNETDVDVVVTTEDKTEDETEDVSNSEATDENMTTHTPSPEVIESDYCSIEKISDNMFKVTSNDVLSDTTKISNFTMGKYVESIDEILVKNGYDAINRDIYYDMMSTSLLTRGGVEAEVSDPHFSIILAYLSQMFEDAAEFKWADIEKDDAKDYCKFTYHIDNSVIVLDTDGVLTWDGADFNITDKVELIKSGLTVSNQTGADVISAAGISVISDNELSEQIASAIELQYAGSEITGVTKEADGWHISLTNDNECILSYLIANTNVTVTVVDATDETKVIVSTSFELK